MPFVLLERLEDYALERLAVVPGEDGRRELHGWFEGVECALESKPLLLTAGLVSCTPLDTALSWHWPMHARVRDDDGRERLLSCMTADPRALAAMHRWLAAEAAGTAWPGLPLEEPAP